MILIQSLHFKINFIFIIIVIIIMYSFLNLAIKFIIIKSFLY